MKAPIAVILSVTMPTVIYAECRSANCHLWLQFCIRIGIFWYHPIQKGIVLNVLCVSRSTLIFANWLLARNSGPYSHYFIFVVTYKSAQKVRVLPFTALESLARDKRYSLVGTFESYKEIKCCEPPWDHMIILEARVPYLNSDCPKKASPLNQ